MISFQGSLIEGGVYSVTNLISFKEKKEALQEANERINSCIMHLESVKPGRVPGFLRYIL